MLNLLARVQAALASRYRVEREIGAGGMATVYLAQDLRHDRNVAVKVLRPELAAAIGAERFLAEIKTTAHLQHPHILSLLDSGEVGGFLYYVMPYVEGESLRSRLSRERQLPIEDAVRIAREAADALDYAHRHGIIHRDIKPENILLTEDHALVADFGIARALSGEAGKGVSGEAQRLTETGFSLGTPAYMSPEQAAGERSLDGRTDIYSLGVVLYEMLAGEPPHSGPTAQAIMARRLSEPAPSVLRLRPAVPDGIDAALRRALAPVPADRFGRAIDFCRALTIPSAAVTIPTQPADATRVAPRAGDANRPRISRTLVLGLGFLLGLGVLFGWLRSRGPREAAGDATSKRLAVLPFQSEGDTNDRVFAAGMSEEITTRLARVPGLSLIARSSALQYPRSGQTAPQFGQTLGVEYVLDGTVRSLAAPDGSKRLRITPELIRVADGTHLWGEPYDGTSADVFRLQSDVAERVAEALQGTLSGKQLAVRTAPTTDLEAFRLYTLGRAEWNLRTPETLERAAGYFRQAIARDSAYARAWAGLADAYALFQYYAVPTLPPDSAYALAKAAAYRAIALDSTLAEPHASLNQILRYGYWDWAGSEREIRRAIQLDPNYATAHKWLAEHLLAQGRAREAIAEARIATQLDPLADPPQLTLGICLWYGGNREAAESVFRQGLQRNPASVPLGGNLLALYMVSGRSADALALLDAQHDTTTWRRVRALALGDSAVRRTFLAGATRIRPPLSHFDLARSYGMLGDTTRAFQELERAVAERDPRLEFIKVDATFAMLRNDPRFPALVRRMGLTP